MMSGQHTEAAHQSARHDITAVGGEADLKL